MSSSSAAFARAISPALMGITEAIHLNTVTTTADIDLAAMNREKFMIFQASVTECCSVDQVIDCVYLDYPPALKEHLLQYTSWCEKRETVRASHEHLDSTLTAQSIPPCLKVKAPEFQFTAKF